MIQFDRTVKILLGLIALFLGILALQPILRFVSTAQAQDGTANSTTSTRREPPVIGHRVQFMSSIAISEDTPIREMQVIDSAQSFVVRYDKKIDVYYVQDMHLNPEYIEKLAEKRGR